ncbi:MAG: SusD/RagB family nutrient-binding outer membrane lipoprotein [Tannerella sp.]|jgi:hypothetical protein|nr:SusD/RagB family nutrient-binding outer membrane lipoprotein [Tannerella sp.]
MKIKKISATILAVCLLFASCEDLTEVNRNPNEITDVGGYLLLSTILTGTATMYHKDNFSDGRISTAVQHLQILNGIGGNIYDWHEAGWTGLYDILRNNRRMYEDAVAQDNHFYVGAALVMRAFVYGYITDLWGDCPYSEALKGDGDIFYPRFDPQEEVYNGILTDLENANTELAKEMPAYSPAEAVYDIAYGGDVLKWRKLANSLALRYYMRLSEKAPDRARAGVEKILSNPDAYPVMTSNDDACAPAYPGVNTWDSWDDHWADGGEFFRNHRPCRTLIDVLQAYSDPRLPVWFTPVEVQLVVEEPPYTHPEEDITVDNRRYVHSDAAILENGAVYFDESEYVGLPPNTIDRFRFNLHPMDRYAVNPHLSYLTPMFQERTHPLVRAVLFPYSEVCFLQAEAAQRGWNTGGIPASQAYHNGIRASLAAWGVESAYNACISQPGVAYADRLEQIIEQKWIASFLLPEAWFDWRRTGYPHLPVRYPEAALKSVVPVRYMYPEVENRYNTAHYNEAVGRLERTEHLISASKVDDPFAKPWIIQGTGKPW